MFKEQKSTVDVTVVSTSKTGENSVRLKSGKVVSIALYVDAAPSKPVNVKIEDENGEELHPAVSYKNYEQTGGAYLESFKPFQIDGNQEIFVKAYSKEAQTSDFSFQMIFNQEQDI